MNANELADELQIVEDKAEAHAMGHIRSVVADAKVMLRQQQAEIEALKRPNNVVGVPQNKLADMQATIRQQQAEIEALKAELETCKTIVALSNIAWKNKFGDDK